LALPPAGGTAKGLNTQFTGGSNLHQRLLTTATDVRLAALHARLLKCEHDYEIAENPAAAQGLSTSSTIQRKNDEASKKAFKALKRANEALINDWPDLQNTTTWFIQDLFGDTGLQNLCQQISQSSQADQSSLFEASIGDSGQLVDLMDQVPQTYRDLAKGGPALEDSYVAPFQLLVHFQEQHKTLWSKLMQEDSAERQALLLQSKKALADLDDNSLTIHGRKVVHLAWKWIEEKINHTKGTMVKHLVVSHHLKAMIKVFGRGVLHFMDKRLETK
jgi:hypothetical protein